MLNINKQLHQKVLTKIKMKINQKQQLRLVTFPPEDEDL